MHTAIPIDKSNVKIAYFSTYVSKSLSLEQYFFLNPSKMFSLSWNFAQFFVFWNLESIQIELKAIDEESMAMKFES
jgi:hypothetical protein